MADPETGPDSPRERTAKVGGAKAAGCISSFRPADYADVPAASPTSTSPFERSPGFVRVRVKVRRLRMSESRDDARGA